MYTIAVLCTPCVLLRGSGVLNFILLFLVVAGAARERFVMFDPPETREPRDVCVTRVWPCAACVRIGNRPVVCGRTKPKGNKKDAHFFGFQLISYILVQFIYDTFIYPQFSFFSHTGYFPLVGFSLPPCGVCPCSAGAVGSFSLTINHFRKNAPKE